jgi:hypothetical protein
VFSKSKIFKFLKRDCGTIPVAEIINGKIEFFSKHQRFLIATEGSKYLLIFFLYYISVLYCVNLEQLYLKDMLAFVVYLKIKINIICIYILFSLQKHFVN